MLKNYFVVAIAIVFFGFGAYIWKIANTGVYLANEKEAEFPSPLAPTTDLVIVGNQAITQDDIEWEYKLLTKGLMGDEELTAIPELPNPELQLAPLREKLISHLIERKLLYKFVQQDQDFTITDPSRYTTCLEQWQRAVEQNDKELFATKEDKERLKSRLCERQIILQYLEERVFARIKISPDAVETYYRDNLQEFTSPPRVVIRQIVLASENEAKRIRHRINRYNFEDLAREVSITPEAGQGGKLGPFAKGEMPRVFDVAFSMRRGEVRGILKSTYGFHIIKLEKKFPKSKLSLSEAREQIVTALRKKKQEEEYQKWVELALSAVQVKSPKSL